MKWLKHAAIGMLVTTPLTGCNSPPSPWIERVEKDRILDIARRDLISLPIYTCHPVSGFPVSERNIVTAAHCLQVPLNVAAVSGYPVRLSPDMDVSKLDALPFDKDWTVLMATRARFKPNRVDATVKIRKGDWVVFAGFRARDAAFYGREHAQRTAEYVLGRVVSQDESTDASGIVKAEVPLGNYHGFSGSPAAIVGADDHIRVWGVVARGSTYRDLFPPWRRHQLAWIVRLPQAAVHAMQDTKLHNPSEWRAMPPPTGRPAAIAQPEPLPLVQ